MDYGLIGGRLGHSYSKVIHEKLADYTYELMPLTEEESIKWGVERHEVVVNYSVGDTVRIADGPLTSFTGRVEALDIDKNSVRVVVSMFGRETPIELELDQVETISD